ncbi:MAG: metal-dependent hydrolase [Mycobacterium sp.]|uniref:metal-dependent hydrolase n=1 Tax=Mycobacterium sp. TaxID=1785 RepID=UPI003F952CD0
MTDLVVRKMPFEFDATVPFLWQPANPSFSAFCNAFTFIAVPFEKYIISALRQAKDRLAEDPGVAAEAEAFLRQEAQHASAHRKHMLALIERYPGLEECYENSVRAYEQLIESHPVEFHAAYVANLEATFTPLFRVILDNRDSLFDGGDRRVASLMMWHFVEEIEHRSSGLILYQHLVDDPWYRVKQIRQTFRHVGELSQKIAESFDKHVPFEDRGVSVQDVLTSTLTGELKYRVRGGRRRHARAGSATTMFHAVPTKQLTTMLWRLLLSQTPNHDPADQPLPDWFDTWVSEYERGTDMTMFYGAPVQFGAKRDQS